MSFLTKISRNEKALIHYLYIVLICLSVISGIKLGIDNPFMPKVFISALDSVSGNFHFIHEVSAAGWLAVLGFWVFRAFRVNGKRFFTGVLFSYIYFSLVVQILSGYLLFLNLTKLQNSIVLYIHFINFILLLLVILYHFVDQVFLKKYKFLKSIFFLRAKWNLVRYLVSFGLVGLGFMYFSFEYSTPLISFKISDQSSIVIDGHANEKEWQKAKVVKINTMDKLDYFNKIPVEIRMLDDGLMAYFHIRWKDDEPNYDHLPLEKVNGKWKVLHDGFEKDNEKTFYEDKLGVMLSKKKGIAGAYSIMGGRKPISGRPENRSGRGYHYTKDGSIRDVWHWKAVRNKDMITIDDAFFGSPAKDCIACIRYKGGFYYDPSDVGSVRSNWKFFKTDYVELLRLPLGDISSNESFLDWADTKIYSADLDNYPDGTRLPSIIYYEDFEGDRADVYGKAHWENGYWNLEISRNLESDSEYDLPINNKTYLWLAVFNHAQTTHSYHLSPLEIFIDE